MLPVFCRNICFTANWETYRNPARVVETKALKSSVVYSVKGFGIKTPPLLISTSMRPNLDTAVSTISAAVFGHRCLHRLAQDSQTRETGLLWQCFASSQPRCNPDPEKLSQDLLQCLASHRLQSLFLVCLPFLSSFYARDSSIRNFESPARA